VNEKPVGLVGPLGFDHATRGTGDCILCHTAVAGNTGLTWAGAAFNHSPLPTDCASCHTSDPLYTAVVNGQIHKMKHTYPGIQDCSGCHTAKAVASGFTPTGWVTETGETNGVFVKRTVLGVFHQNTPSPTTCVF